MSFKVKSGLSGLNPEKTIVFSRSVLTHMEGNPSFPSPPETPAEITVKADILQEVQQKILQGHIHLIPLRKSAMDAVHSSMSKLCTYVNLTADGNQSMLETSGFPFVKAHGPRPAPEQVSRLSVTQGNSSGCTKLKWKGEKSRAGYNYQLSYSPMEESSWISVGQSTKPHAVVDGLEAGKRCWFRVAAYNAAGSGAWSEPVAFMVG
jgi:hypothetical protein